MKAKDTAAKEKYKEQYDKRYKTDNSNLQLDDMVLCKQNQSAKHIACYDPVPYRITKILGGKVTAEREGHSITRNSCFFKKLEQGQSIENWMQ